MTLNLDQFLPEAGMNQIRKAIKLMPDEQKQETAAWLNEQRIIVRGKALDYFDRHLEEKKQILELEHQAEMLKSYQEEKEQLTKIRQQLSQCRMLSSQYRRKAEAALKLKNRYVKIVEITGV